MPHYTHRLKIRWRRRGGVSARAFRTIVMAWMVASATGLLGWGAQSAAISQGYKPDGSLAPGALVSIENSQDTVTAADSSNPNQLFGVVVGTNSTPLAVNSAATTVQVATNGEAQVFVSDLNGSIKSGDQIAPSAIRGVGMKVSTSGKIIGIAQHDFNGSGGGSTVQIHDANGKTQAVHVGQIPVAVQVVYYTVPQKSVVPGFIQQFAVSVTGKTISVFQLTVVLVIVGAALIVVGFLMFAAVRGSIVSLGRNPLAASSIYRGTFQAVAASMTILLVAVFGAYMVLRY